MKILHSDGSAGLIYAGAASYDFEKKLELQSRILKRRMAAERLLSKLIGTF
jgi:hypothetical protein